MMMIVVPDTSVVVDGRFYTYLTTHEIQEIIIPEAVVAEIEHQANVGKSAGVSGLKELLEIRNYTTQRSIPLSFHGRRPSINEIRLAREGEIDELVRLVASDFDAHLVTGDKIQAHVAMSKGINTIFLEPYGLTDSKIEDFFDKTTMSAHLKAGIPVFSKKGRPGAVEVVKSTRILDEKELEEIAIDIIERAKNTRDCFIELDEPGATIVQLREYRIAITKPPFSDRFEITAARPVKKVKLEEYDVSSKLKERLKVAEGILVSGAPGAGKSTFVQAIAEYYNSQGKIVKTMEKPRDLQVSEEITQYTALSGDMAKTGDILLLVRPDFTIFDEMRKTGDFLVFSDLRLAGVGMIGVVHATRTIDAIQRFIGRIELGMIPQIVDTVIHIEGGEIKEIFMLEFKVKTPSGMSVADLARPVIEVYNFDTHELQFEIYTFGEQVVVMEVNKQRSTPASRHKIQALEDEIMRIVPNADIHVEMNGPNRAIVHADPYDVPYIIGKKGKVISKIENKMNIKIDVVEEHPNQSEEIPVHVKALKKYIHLAVDRKYANKTMRFFLDGKEMFTSTTSKKGLVKIEKKSDFGSLLASAKNTKKFIYATLV
ncbi:MAG: KH domain-containing protein [Candidatus Methanofastidiosia archaeon]